MAIRGHGTKLYLVSGTDTTAVADMRDIEGPEESVDDIDVSNTDSPNRRREFLPGMVDGGEASGDFLFAASTYGDMKTLVGVTQAFRIQFADHTVATSGSKLDWVGYIKNLGPSAPYEDAVTASLTLKVSGEITFTEASA